MREVGQIKGGGERRKEEGREKRGTKLERRVDSSVEKKVFGNKTGNRQGSTYNVFQVSDFL